MNSILEEVFKHVQIYEMKLIDATAPHPKSLEHGAHVELHMPMLPPLDMPATFVVPLLVGQRVEAGQIGLGLMTDVTECIRKFPNVNT